MKNLLDQKLFKEMADQSLIGFLLFNPSTKSTIYINSMACQILDVELNEETELNIEQLVPKNIANPKNKAFSLDLIQHEGLFQNIVFSKVTDHQFIGSCGVRHLQVEDQSLVLLMIQDVTLQAKLHREVELKQNQLKLAYSEVLEQNKQLKDLDVAKNRFIALVTHELRTPASAVVATAEMLKLGIYDDQEQLNEFIGMIYSEGKLLLELINDILDFAKIQAGKMDYYIEEKNINEILSQNIEKLIPLAEKSDVELILEAPDAELKCYFDTVRMSQIVTNIVSNAIKYNRKSGRVRVWAEDAGKNIKINIEDTGLGISVENQKLVFNEFETLGKISSHTKGTGLGLPISKKMIESMGGLVDFTSTEGKGSHFWIEVPKTKVLGESDNYRSRAEDGIEDLAA